jgi:hypothetical protein
VKVSPEKPAPGTEPGTRLARPPAVEEEEDMMRRNVKI